MRIVKVASKKRIYDVKISDQDWPLVSRYKWIWREGYAQTRMDGKYYSMHRMIMNVPPGEKILVDHKDNDHANNQRENLRRANRFQNQQNRLTNKKNKLPKGIRLLPSGKYNARVQAYNQRVVFGAFDTVEQAVEARNAKAKELHGEFFRAAHLLEKAESAK